MTCRHNVVVCVWRSSAEPVQQELVLWCVVNEAADTWSDKQTAHEGRASTKHVHNSTTSKVPESLSSQVAFRCPHPRHSDRVDNHRCALRQKHVGQVVDAFGNSTRVNRCSCGCKCP